MNFSRSFVHPFYVQILGTTLSGGVPSWPDYFIYVFACVLGRRANAIGTSGTFTEPSIKLSEKTVPVVSWKSFVMVSYQRIVENVHCTMHSLYIKLFVV